MYDINVKVIKRGRRFFYIFLGAGILFLVIMGAIYISGIKRLKSLKSTVMSTSVEVRQHTDSDGDIMYSPVYHYRVRGESYTCSSTSSSSIYPGTENKLVYYDSKNPANCMTEYSKSSNNILLFAMLLPVLFIGVAVFNILKINKRVKAVLELNQTGKLVKNLPYRLEDTGMVVNGVPIQRPVVDYVLPTGVKITLRGDPRHDKKQFDADGMVDLVIEENNPDNYFIDFEINRISGNRPEDYYQQPGMAQNMNNGQQQMYAQPQVQQMYAQPQVQQMNTQPQVQQMNQSVPNNMYDAQQQMYMQQPQDQYNNPNNPNNMQ